MDITDSLAISVSALDAQRRRLNVIASNLANAQSTHSPEGGPYRRRDVVFQSAPVQTPFQRALRVSSMRMDGPISKARFHIARVAPIACTFASYAREAEIIFTISSMTLTFGIST